MTTPLVASLAIKRHGIRLTATRQFQRYFSTAPAKKVLSQESKNRGAFAVLKALNEVHEKDGVQVARLVSSLEALLPMGKWEEEHPEESSTSADGHTTSQPHTSDPAFFSFPLFLNQNEKLRLGITLSSQHVLQILQATRRGKRVALETMDVLLKTAAWYFRKKPKVIRLDALQDKQTLTVVGDLHGSLSDLEAVLGLTGEPSPDNLVLFNGDLADRGDHGVEVLATVITLWLAFPDYVFINRGNHEDLALSVAYGLASEVQHKYGASVFRNELGPRLDAFFCSLPLATVIQNDALIVHGGPPPPGVTLGDVETHLALQMQQQVGNHDCFSRTIRTGQKDHRVEEIMESLLWSDPEMDEVDGHSHLAAHPNHQIHWDTNTSRGAGFRFDANAVEAVLRQEGLRRLIRSHEPVHDGCVRYSVGDTSHTTSGSENNQQPMEFFTVFSASRYPYKEGFNRGAVLVLMPDGEHRIRRYSVETDDPKLIPTDMMFQEQPCISTKSSTLNLSGDGTSTPVDLPSLRRALREAAAPHRVEIFEAMKKSKYYYPVGKKMMPFSEAVRIFSQALQIEHAMFRKQGPQIALARALTNQCQDEIPDTIELEECIKALFQEMDDDQEEDDSTAFHPEMAPHYPWLRAVFEMVDVDHDGVISRSEWMAAVAKINAKLPKGSKPIRAEETWNLLDLNGDGKVGSDEWDGLAKALCR